MASSSAESNATCELIRQLFRRNDDEDDEPLISTSGHESAKYLLTEVINPALCVVRLLAMARTRLSISISGLSVGVDVESETVERLTTE